LSGGSTTAPLGGSLAERFASGLDPPNRRTKLEKEAKGESLYAQVTGRARQALHWKKKWGDGISGGTLGIGQLSVRLPSLRQQTLRRTGGGEKTKKKMKRWLQDVVLASRS